jgi:gliding motility-associated-like protein
MDYPVRINVVQKPEVNLIDTIYFNGETTLEVAQGYASYQWSTGDSIYYITVTEEGEYSVIIQTEEGCESRDTAMLVNVAVPIQVPNAFTPNGDGLNDTFKPIITRPDLVVNYHLSIYNRWGECFLETRDTAKGWDGKDAPAGVYSWVISYSDIVGKVVKMRGSVTLVK